MPTTNEPRDLLAERIRRLEAGLADLTEEIVGTRAQVRHAAAHLDTLVDLVGRLSRVVDVQGSSIPVEESDLEKKVGSIEGRVEELVAVLATVVDRLEAIGSRLGDVPRR